MAKRLAHIQWTSAQLDRYVRAFILFTRGKMKLADKLDFAEEQMRDAEAEVTDFLADIGLWDRAEDWDYDADEGAISLTLHMGDEPEISETQKQALARAGFRRIYFDGFGAAARLVLDS